MPAKKLINKGITGEISAIVSKAVPECELPCEVFVYASAEGDELSISHTTAKFYPAAETGGYGSCTSDFYYAYFKGSDTDCDRFYDERDEWLRDIQAVNWDWGNDWVINGKAAARFVLFDVEPIEFNDKATGQADFYCDQSRIEKLSGLNFNDIYDRIGKRLRLAGTRIVGYLWCICDFTVLEKPKELGEFRKAGYMIAYDKLIEEAESTYNQDFGPHQPYKPYMTMVAENRLEESVVKLDKEHEVQDQVDSWFDPDDPDWSEVEYVGKV